MKKLKVQKVLLSWQVFNAAREVLGLEYLYHLWGYRNARQIQAWCSDPRECDSAMPNPIDKLQLMLEELIILGRRDIALAALRCLARPLGFEVRDPKKALSDKKDITLEYLDLSQAHGEVGKALKEALEDGEITEEEVANIEETADRLIDEALQIKDAVRKAKNKEEN